MKKIFAFILTVAVAIGLVSCGDKMVDNPPSGENYFIATVTEITENYFMVEVTDKGNTNMSAGSEATVSLKDLDIEIGYNILEGDSIKVTFNGEIMEKDPLSLGKIYSIEKEEVGRQDYFDAEVLEVNESSLLVECTKCEYGGISEGSQVVVSLNTLSSEEVPVVKAGDKVRVVYIGGVKETYPLQLGDTVSVFLMTEDGEIITKTSGIPAPANSDSDWGITLSVDNITPTGMTLYIVQSGGEPTGELQYGSDYHLKVLEDGNWIDVPYVVQGDVAWTAEAYMVVMDASTPLDIYWERLYGSLPAGTYRISKGFIDFRAGGDYDNQIFYAEFEIK